MRREVRSAVNCQWRRQRRRSWSSSTECWCSAVHRRGRRSCCRRRLYPPPRRGARYGPSHRARGPCARRPREPRLRFSSATQKRKPLISISLPSDGRGGDGGRRGAIRGACINIYIHYTCRPPPATPIA